MTALYITPQAGSGGVNLRSKPQVDQSTLLGTLNEGLKLELDKQGADWNTGKVYVSTQVAGVSGGTVSALPGWDTINIRLAPSTDPSTDVGDLKQGPEPGIHQRPDQWLVCRAGLSLGAVLAGDQRSTCAAASA